MFLFILESIGTSELLLIGLMALILLGPRKLPDLARTFGKIMSEFRRSTDEFKQTWEREVASEINQFKDETTPETIPNTSNKNEQNKIALPNQIALPEIKEVSGEEFKLSVPDDNSRLPERAETEDVQTGKQNWL